MLLLASYTRNWIFGAKLKEKTPDIDGFNRLLRNRRKNPLSSILHLRNCPGE